jgi:hypothetical protein
MPGMDYPFLFVNHGPLDVDCIDKCEEIFLWFTREVTPAERKRIEAGCPEPISSFSHWDRTFCYFGSHGDVYDGAITMGYAPAAVRKALERADPARDAKAWQRAYQRAMDHFEGSLAAYCEDVERWAREVHAIVPIAVLWGPHGADEDDPWNRYSRERFAEVMYERIRTCKPLGSAGKEHLGYIRGMCGDLLTAPKRSGKKGGAADPAADARAAAVLDDTARERRPRRFVSRLGGAEHGLLELGEQVGRFAGDGKDSGQRLGRLAPLTQLVFYSSYDASNRGVLDAVADLPALFRPLLAALPADQRRSIVPLLTMTAQTLAHDTPAFDRPRKEQGARAAEVLRLALDQPRCGAGTFARTSRYLRWAGRAAEARAVVDEGLARHGDRPVLLRAGVRAARALGDAAAGSAYAARLAREPGATAGSIPDIDDRAAALLSSLATEMERDLTRIRAHRAHLFGRIHPPGALLPDERWAVNLEEPSFTITWGDQIVTRCDAQLVGTWSRRDGTFLWGDANPSVAAAGTKLLAAWVEQAGLLPLHRCRRFRIEEGAAMDLAGLLAARFGWLGPYPAVNGDAVALLLVKPVDDPEAGPSKPWCTFCGQHRVGRLLAGETCCVCDGKG